MQITNSFLSVFPGYIIYMRISWVVPILASILILGVIVPSLSISPDEAYANKKIDKKYEKFR